MSKLFSIAKVWATGVALGLTSLTQVYAQTNEIVRVSSFEYDTDGRLVKEVIEPDSPQDCLQTVHSYNAQGNPSGQSSSTCAGASGHTLSSAGTRSASKEYLAQSVVIGGVSYSTPAGVFATRSTNALNQSESYEYDPRHGKVTKLTGPNGGVTTWTYDGFGRKTRENRADGTYTIWEYQLCGGKSGQPLAQVCANAVSFGELIHESEWFVKEVSYGTNNVALTAAKYQVYDTLGRVVRVRSDSFMADTFSLNRYGSAQDTVYNALGQKVAQSMAYLLMQGISPQWVTYKYDDIGRVVEESTPDGEGGSAVLKTRYEGLTTTITNALSQTKTIYKNAVGLTERIVDALGGQVLYTYDALGQLTKTNANGSITQLTYDVRGRKTGMQDPSMGRWDYAYNAYGELVWQQDSLSQVATIGYDALGRMVSRDEPDLRSRWYYDKKADNGSCGAGIGKLCEALTLRINNTVEYRRLHTYDTMGRPTSTSNVLDNAAQPAVTTQVYDTVTGRLKEQTWPTGYKAIYEYTEAGFKWSAGHLWRVRGMDGATQNVLWQAMDKNPQGALIRYLGGNGVVTDKNINQVTGRTQGIKSTLTDQANGNVLNHSYTYDKLGNLMTRADANTGVSEAFSYDSLNRLSMTTTLGGGLENQQQVQLLYDARGNITYKSDVGYYHYDTDRPNRLLQITTTGDLAGVTVPSSGTKALHYAFDDLLSSPTATARSIDVGQGNLAMGNGNLMYTVSDGRDHGGAHTVRWEEYTSFNKIRQMRFGNLTDPANPTQAVADRTVDLVYGPEHQRLRQTITLTSNAPSHMEAGTTWYMNGPDSVGLSYEKEVKANGLIEHTHYLGAGGEVFAQFTKREGALNGKPAQQVSYFHQDHLGSLAVITNEAGLVIERLAYDPWGKRRFSDGNKDGNDTLTSAQTKRGFTMHEHMDEMGVINMNGRVYDPTIGRFLTADPYIQAPDHLQSYNRYSYVLNNPLAYSDPTGYWSWKKAFKFVAAIVVAVVVPMAMPAIYGAMGAAAGFATTMTGYTLTGAIAGGLSTAAGGGNRKAITRGFLSGAMFGAAGSVGKPTDVSRYAAHMAAGCVSAVSGGGKCGQGAASALIGKYTTNHIEGIGGAGIQGDIARGAMTAVSGGVASMAGGGDFKDGAKTAAFGYLFNFCVHNKCFNRAFTSVDAARHWQGGSGAPVTDVDINEINQRDASARWADQKRSEIVVSLSLKFDSGITYGQIRGTVSDSGSFTPAQADHFDFEYHGRDLYDSTGDWVKRNAANFAAGLYYQKGAPYDIYFKGAVQLSDSLMKQLGLNKQ